LRDGVIKDIPSFELVPGDLVIVEGGSVPPMATGMKEP
jgi:magnesium-transporting ATPase (P-type)